MSPEDRQQFNQMKTDLERIKSATDVNFVAELRRRLGQGTVTIEDGASSTGTTIAVRDATDTTTEIVADDYDGVLTITDNRGNSYRIGYYS